MKKILVIEDETSVRQNLVDLLNVEGYLPIEARDGEEGVSLAWEMLPDLILCDINMPKLDGFGVLSRISRDPSTATIPFIFLTARAERDDLRRGMSLGADDFITKPFTIDEVLQAVETRLGKRDMIENQAEKNLAELNKTVRLSLPGEMLSPLSVIISSSELLSNQKDVARLDPGQISSLGHDIHKAAGLLMRSIQNYMLFSELEVVQSDPGRLNALRESRTFSAWTAITEMATLKARQDGRESDLQIQVEDFQLRISEMYLQRIVEELLEHAFHSSPAGTPIEITGEVRMDLQQFMLRVSDHGRGMKPDEVAVLTGKSQPGAWVIDSIGHSIGLVVVRRLVELHQGSFNIQSQPDHGTVIALRIPLASAYV